MKLRGASFVSAEAISAGAMGVAPASSVIEDLISSATRTLVDCCRKGVNIYQDFPEAPASPYAEAVPFHPAYPGMGPHLGDRFALDPRHQLAIAIEAELL